MRRRRQFQSRDCPAYHSVFESVDDGIGPDGIFSADSRRLRRLSTGLNGSKILNLVAGEQTNHRELLGVGPAAAGGWEQLRSNNQTTALRASGFGGHDHRAGAAGMLATDFRGARFGQPALAVGGDLWGNNELASSSRRGCPGGPGRAVAADLSRAYHGRDLGCGRPAGGLAGTRAAPARLSGAVVALVVALVRAAWFGRRQRLPADLP